MLRVAIETAVTRQGHTPQTYVEIGSDFIPDNQIR